MRAHVFKLLGVSVLACLLGFFYYKSTAIDAKQHVKISSELRNLHQLEERLDQFALQRRVGILRNYDPLVQIQQQIQSIIEQLSVAHPVLFLRDESELSRHFAEYIKLRAEKRELIETFKSQNAVLRNSVRYFPVAVQNLLEGPNHIKDGDPLEVEVRDHLLHDMLVYQINPSETGLIAIQDSLARIAERAALYPPDQKQQIDALIMHAGIMVAYKDETDRTLASILGSPSTAVLDEVFNLYSLKFEQAEHEANLYRFWLMLFALFGLIYGVYSLIRISKARDELNKSVTELEFQKFALDQHSIVSIADRSGKILYTNDKFTEISQYQREELIGQDHRLLNSGYHPSSFFKEMWQTIGHGEVWQGEVKNRRKDGSFYWVDSTIVPFMDDDGKPIRYVSIRSDITERKQAEADMLRAKVVAEEASQAKSDFLANMSHEIRTPMNGIIGMTELALDTELNEEQREFIGLVKTSADSLLTIVNDILDFSKIEAGKMEIEDIEFCPQDMLSQTVRSTALRAHQKGLELLLDIDQAIPQRLIGDPGRLRQIILNLIGNAIKFTEQGEIVVRASLREGDDEARHISLRISVSDTGIGIPADKQQAIFESFSQADTSTTRKYGGTGLGLTITTRLVELMQGHIRVESEVGKGSTFYVELTLQRTSQSVKPKFEAGKLADMNVLVVDDNATNREIAVKLLRGWKMNPHAVESGEQAIAELDRASQVGHEYQLLLLDVRMPATDGFGVVEHLRQHPALTAAPIMMLTSEGQRGDAARCKELGIGAYLLKPFAQAELFAAIMNTLGLENLDKASLITRHTLQQSKRSLRVLLAEDNSVNQTLATRLLQKFGHEVDVAANGVIAVERWKQGAYDLILMDVDMPELNGYGATAQIRAAEQLSGSHIPIIGLTAHAMQGAREECIAHGMDGYLTKPIDTEALWVELEGVKTTTSALAEEVEHKVGQEPARFDFEIERVMGLMAGDRALFTEMVRIYRSDYPKYLASLDAAIKTEDAEQVRYFAHTIKGMLSVFAVEEVADIASHIEEQVGADHRADQQALVYALQWLEKELDKHVDSIDELLTD